MAIMPKKGVEDPRKKKPKDPIRFGLNRPESKNQKSGRNRKNPEKTGLVF